VVRIGVDASHQREALRCFRQEFPDDNDLYEICDPWKSSYEQSSIELSPGAKIVCTGGDGSRRQSLFSGAVTHERGLTVAHATRPGANIEVGSSADFVIIGKCLEAHGCLQRQNGEKLTADLALLELDPQYCSVDNIVHWPAADDKTLKIKIYKGQKLPANTDVMILDQDGKFKRGNILRDHTTDTKLPGDGLHNVLAIGVIEEQNEDSVTREGDSGALVMSRSSSENEVVYVHGIVIGVYKETSVQGKRTLTVANSLWDVIHVLCTNDHTQLQSHISSVDDIDFI